MAGKNIFWLCDRYLSFDPLLKLVQIGSSTMRWLRCSIFGRPVNAQCTCTVQRSLGVSKLTFLEGQNWKRTSGQRAKLGTVLHVERSNTNQFMKKYPEIIVPFRRTFNVTIDNILGTQIKHSTSRIKPLTEPNFTHGPHFGQFCLMSLQNFI